MPDTTSIPADPPELWWSRDLVWMRLGDGRFNVVGTATMRSELSADAVRLIPEPALDAAIRSLQADILRLKGQLRSEEAACDLLHTRRGELDASLEELAVENTRLRRAVANNARMRHECFRAQRKAEKDRRALWELLKEAVREYRTWRRRAQTVNSERAKANSERDRLRAENTDHIQVRTEIGEILDEALGGYEDGDDSGGGNIVRDVRMLADAVSQRDMLQAALDSTQHALIEMERQRDAWKQTAEVDPGDLDTTPKQARAQLAELWAKAQASEPTPGDLITGANRLDPAEQITGAFVEWAGLERNAIVDTTVGPRLISHDTVRPAPSEEPGETLDKETTRA